MVIGEGNTIETGIFQSVKSLDFTFQSWSDFTDRFQRSSGRTLKIDHRIVNLPRNLLDIRENRLEIAFPYKIFNFTRRVEVPCH